MKPAPWFFVPFTPPGRLPAAITLTDPDLCHRLATVMRMKPGDPVVLVHPDLAQAFSGTLVTLAKKEITVTLSERLNHVAQPLPCTIAVALVKGERWEWLLEKLTELGVSAIQPLITERTVVHLKDPEAKLARWWQILTQAAEQSEQVIIPTLMPPESLAVWLGHQHAPGLNLVAMERTEVQGRQTLLQTLVADVHVTIAIGPEGGWADGEVTAFQTHGFQPVSLGETLLKSETAAVYAASVIRCAEQSLTAL